MKNSFLTSLASVPLLAAGLPTPARVWSTVDDYSILANDVGQASCADILVTPSGDVYATGGSALGAGPGFMVRKRPVGASAFTTVDGDYSRQTARCGLGSRLPSELWT